ncbi:class I SAM-dependent methyltransferase [Micrococcus endophyticus]|uniref:SAM-dependent methyltransferase n=1 Tax=Micrococcus endophyticus TaxID=455343 RepID=A0A7W9N127_9MICC|nr:class I SAM-dependent methyltransferase [Micrococcus endophyticus]MBB5849645.1 SAM-dependent methyltransferase [Micrococcus endophyticus]
MHLDPAETNRRAYDDARVVALYDLDNPPGEDHAYFRRAAEESGARRIVDLGCGTGSLTVTLTGDDRAVVGIDPAEAMLRVARARPGGDRVEWRRGTAELIEPASADLVIMSGNVAMHLIGQDWHGALRRIAAGLVPGGRLLFETRNPVRRAWEDWQQEPTERTTAAGRLVESEATNAPDADGVVVHR